jgi:uncharacterized protein YjbJ (UPF0337 family)
MLWTIAVVLLILWLLGMVSSYTLGGFIHILLVLAIIVILIRVIQGRSPVAWWKSVRKKKVRRGGTVNKDQVKGKVKDVAGRVERQAGEWTGDEEAQVRGAAKQAEGKVQKAWGDAKEALKKSADKQTTPRRSSDDTAEINEEDQPHRKAS